MRSIFYKPVDRPIEGVIKADDNASLGTEVDEYVLTNEIEKRLELFLDAYIDYENANGVWISGFFGSGKSHLLKMMALLLANQDAAGIDVNEAFQKKCLDNELLKAKIAKAVAIPSQSILFNIDQKADVINSKDVDAVLSVFAKVFDETCGYFGKQGYIAQFERQLDEDGLLEGFCEAFEKHEGQPWSWGRERINRVRANVDLAYQDVTGRPGDGIIDRYKADYKLSIEDFALQVQKYIDQRDSDFRLNFFVDEVGQYIAGSTKLMTNLQTIAESLATKCRGRAWIIVTAQEDMSTVIGEMELKESELDFSKIQARFATRMKLTSTNVAEVIQKRLLRKNEDGEKALRPIYREEVTNFHTLFDFADGQRYRNFEDEDHFVNCYPFIPYQFDLFQLAIRGLSAHNAFEGKHSSVGERSMLGVFQEVAVQIADNQLGELATFDLMYKGISSALKSHLLSVRNAEKHLDNKLAVRLLKALLLVKYVREFRATIRNLCVLMIPSFDEDMEQLRKDVEEALNLLENQIYIQRNGDVYEFLSDEEKDIEQEIKNTEVDSTEVADELHKILFDKVLKTRKLRYEPTKRDFSFTRKLDDKIYGREQELAVHVISPFHEHCEKPDHLKMTYMGRDELTVVLPADARLIRDITLLKQTAKYVGQNIALTKKENVKRILSHKTMGNQQRERDLAEHAKKLMSKARMFVAGSAVESSSEDPNLRVHEGFERLVEQTYPNLRMLRGVIFTEAQIEHCLEEASDGLFGNDATTMTEPETEMLASLNRSSQKGIRTSIKSLTDDFERKPFGWPLPAIQCVLAKLIARGKVEARCDGVILEGTELLGALTNTRQHGNVVLEPQIEFTASQVRRLKEFYEQFFDAPPKANEARALGAETASAFVKLHDELSLLAARTHEYPFLSVLAEPIANLARLGTKSFKHFLAEFESDAEELLDQKEDLIDPVRRFMSGSQARLYAEAKEFIDTHATNFDYIDGDDADRLRQVISDTKCFVGSGMKDAKDLLDRLRGSVTQKAAEVREAAENAIREKVERLYKIDGYESLEPEKKGEIKAIADKALSTLESQPLIAVVKETASRFEQDGYKTALSKITEWTQPSSTKASQGDSGDVRKPVKIEYVPESSISVPFDKAWLESEQDVDDYLAAVRKELLKVIGEGKRVQI